MEKIHPAVSNDEFVSNLRIFSIAHQQYLCYNQNAKQFCFRLRAVMNSPCTPSQRHSIDGTNRKKWGETMKHKRLWAALTAAGSLAAMCSVIPACIVSAIDGTLIKELTVNDTENASDWSIVSGLKRGDTIYGDRDLTATSVPEKLANAEFVKTACDSKMYTDELGSFSAAADINVYLAVDDRVNTSLDWLSTWTKTGEAVTTSNGVTLELFRKAVRSGETVTLGTNGGQGESANYLIFALRPADEFNLGDVDKDGAISAKDLTIAKRIALGKADMNSAADVNCDGAVDKTDVQWYVQFLTVLTNAFPEKVVQEVQHMDGKTYMAQIRQTLTNTAEPNGATAENAGTAYGTYKKETIYSDVCKRSKSFNVLIPAGYTTNKQYPVMYCMHGYWGDEDALLDKGDATLRLRQIIGNAIASGEAEDMIVVFPDIYASATQDKCNALDDKNNAAYDNFINLLTKEIMPFMEKNYSIKTGRENTAITGFSMGGRESLYIGFSRPDLFGYIGAMCPAPGVPLQKSQFTFRQDEQPFLLHVSAGSNDTLIYSTPEGYHNTMTQVGTDHIWHYVQGGDHGGKTIRPHMYYFVREVFKA